jgi:GNAT superfamily N-acetyltransferase
MEPGGLILATPGPADWQQFFRLAAAEGWRVPLLERRLFAGPWSGQALVLKHADRFAGLVTAVAHQRSGWIGNLLVPPELRGRGYGSRLFRAALDRLHAAGMTRVWLTASELGRPLYEKSGFQVIDQIERWTHPPRDDSFAAPGSNFAALEQLLASERRVWGEERSELLRQVCGQGQLFSCRDSIALLQTGEELQMIGPWYSADACPRSNRQLLQQLLAAAVPSVELVTDMLASSPLRGLLMASGFQAVGRTLLMARGDTSAVDLSQLVTLASLGSFG